MPFLKKFAILDKRDLRYRKIKPFIAINANI